VSEIRLAARRLMHRRSVMMISVITLATAIGAAAATWSLLSAVLLNPLPVRDPERLAMVGSIYQSGGISRTGGATYPYYRHVSASSVFDSIAGVWLTPLPLRVNNQTAPETTPVQFVSRSFFDVLGIATPVGRGFSAADDRRGAPVVAVLSDRYWYTMFAADPAVLGRPLTVGNRTATIVGVAPRGFRGLSLAQAPAIFLPLETIADVGPGVLNYFADPSHQSSPTAGVGMIGRLRAGETFDLARVHLDALSPPSGPGASMGSMKLAAVMVASIVPLRRALRVDPMALMRTT
jgi:putative ABC transport system permease protein